MAKQIKLDTSGLDKIIKASGQATVKRYIIHDGVEYGVFQEFTEKGHPSLVPAFEKHTKRLPKAIGQAVEKALPLDDILRVAAFNIQRDWASDVNVDTGAYKNSIQVSVE